MAEEIESRYICKHVPDYAGEPSLVHRKAHFGM